MRLYYILIACAVVLSSLSCGGGQESPLCREVDSLNDMAYRSHYKDVESVRAWAHEALFIATRERYDVGRDEALNNIAFERFQQMDFDSALIVSGEVISRSNSVVERLVADVMQMKVAQRTSDNLSFFKNRTDALKCIDKLESRIQRMSERELHRYKFGRSDFHIVSSTYFYYLDQTERALNEIRAAEPYCTLETDTAQWLYYCYMRGSGGLAESDSYEGVAREEFGYLLKCFWLARYENYAFFLGNAEQSMASLLADETRSAAALGTYPEAIPLLAAVFDETDLPMSLAKAALDDFVAYDDIYQEACALRTLGELTFASGDYDEALRYYTSALECVNFHHQCYYASDELLDEKMGSHLLVAFDPSPNPVSVEREWVRSPNIKTVPEWISGIRQQLSLAYSALNQKAASDYNRNIFLDLLDLTREDAELESRVAELTMQKQHLQRLIVVVCIVACLTALFVLYLLKNWRKRSESQRRLLRQKMQHIQDVAEREQQQMADEQEQLEEEKRATELRLMTDKQQNIEKRAKLQLVMGIMPFLDRIMHEVERMREHNNVRPESLSYIKELTEHINQMNDILTDWIKMQQGQLSLSVSTFDLEGLFDSIRRSHFAFDQKGVTLDVDTTDLAVKADKALTLFMINTLTDNARKFTPSGGSVHVTATSGNNDDGNYVEISVTDTGCGLSASDVSLILNNKVYDAAAIGTATGREDLSHQLNNPVSPVGQRRLTSETAISGQPRRTEGQKGFGFGLMNCKGIIEKYRKTSRLFSVCQFGIDSRVGEGSRFWFRLPRVASMVVLMLLALESHASFPQRAYALADSVYFCNLDSRFEEALCFADSAFALIGTGRDSVDYSLVLGLRNEQAVAALALNDWDLYKSCNDTYKQLYKLVNRDESLDTYCLELERSHQTSRWALVAIIVLCVIAALSTYIFYFLPRARFAASMNRLNALRLQQLQKQKALEHQRQKDDIELAEDEHRKRLYEENRLHVQNMIIDNSLSTIKHETMYYPGRINQLVDRLQNEANQASNLATLSETVSYYREIYSILSAQAMQQSEALNFRRRNIDYLQLITPVLQRFHKIAQRSELDIELQSVNGLGAKTFRGDADLITMLINSLLDAELRFVEGLAPKHVKLQPLQISAVVDGGFARIQLTNPNIELTDEDLHTLFSPHAGGIPFLIARQIIREHDTFMGHPGCRINAEQSGAGHAIWFTIPVSRSNETEQQ